MILAANYAAPLERRWGEGLALRGEPPRRPTLSQSRYPGQSRRHRHRLIGTAFAGGSSARLYRNSN